MTQFAPLGAALAPASAVPPHTFAAAFERHAVPAALITAAFALLAYRMRAVTPSGALAGAVVSFLLYVCAGLGGFLSLVVVFVITAGTTRLRYQHKQRLQLAESRGGRNGWQVSANLALAATLSVLSLYFWWEPLRLAMVAALAEAACDTASSECGKALAIRVYLITNFRRVAMGTDGAISLLGTLCGVVAALLVAVVAAWCNLLPSLHWIAAAAGAGTLGMFIDSFLGATLQQRGWLSNSGVNFLSTVAAAGIALVFLA